VRFARAATIGAVVATCALGGFYLIAGPAMAGAEGSVTRESLVEAGDDEPRFERSYRYAGGAAGKKAIEDAVEEAVRQMNPLIRRIARRRMLEANAVIPRLRFRLGGDPIVASYVGGRIVEAPADGRAVPWTDQYGETIEVSHRLHGSTLVQTMTGAQGNRTNEYRFTDDGKTMTMTVEISAKQMPSPLRYSVRYRQFD
jgi:hypothetical protein